MIKRALTIGAFVVAVPALTFAASWTLNTWVKSSGGVMVSRNNANQTSANGSVFKSYTTHAVLPYSVNANNGYTISNLTVNGATVGAASGQTTYNGNAQGMSAQSVYASFIATTYTETATASSGGTVTPASIRPVYLGTQTYPQYFTFSPSSGYSLSALTITNATATCSTDGGSTYGSCSASYAANTTVKVKISSISGNVTLNGAFAGPPVANAGATQTSLVGQSTTLSGSASSGTGPYTYLWSQTGGPVSVTYTAGPAAATAKFVAPSTPGLYTFNLKVTDSASNFANDSTNVNVTASTASAAYSQCTFCHNNNNVGGAGAAIALYNNWSTSIHSRSTHAICSSCHYGTLDGSHPGSVSKGTVTSDTFVTTVPGVVGGNGVVLNQGDIFCTSCHRAPYAIPHPTNLNTGITCAKCHTDAIGQNSGTGDAHSIQGLPKCIECHSIAQAQVAPGLVNDNNGVRSITQEFGKWSHHVTGATLNDAHCAACHLEGKVSGTEIAVDSTKHMVDGIIHLRNSDTDADMAWDPAAPNHSTMDNYCMSCHDANGAISPGSQAIQAFINANGIAAPGKTASASNPFGDTISNRYDKMQRPAVTNVDSQFNTANNSHHGVKGPRYTGRTRLAGPRQIANPAAFANNSTAILKGVRKTMYDAGVMNNLYSPLENAGGEAAPRTGSADLGDDSTLHCGDCHTVGQWKVGSSETANGSPTPAAIGAHGSNNEYLLRNSIGTDQRHTQNAFVVASGTVTYTNPNGAFLVCYNCHSYTKYGSIYSGTGLNVGQDRQPHAGEYDSAGRCNGVGNTIPFNGYTTGKATDGTQFASRFMGTAPGFTMPTSPTGPATPLQYTSPAPYAGEQPADFGNIYGIQCLNCHNSGAGNAYGGIHGSANNSNTTLATVDPSVTGGAYIDGMGNTTKHQRFLPGLGNAMHVPGTLGGFTGGTVAFKNGSTASGGTYTTGAISNDTNWEQKHWQQTASTNFNLTTGAVTGTLTSAGAGCYTLGGATAATSRLEGPSVTGAGGPATELIDTWGGCDDHGAKQGNGDHGFAKRIVRPVTY
jgi:hypothetical protein